MEKLPEDRFPDLMAFVDELTRPLASPEAAPSVSRVAMPPASGVRPRTTQPFSAREHLLVHLGGVDAQIHRARDLAPADGAISSETAFVVSLLEDDLTVGDLLAVSPLDEETTLAALDQLRHAGVIAVVSVPRTVGAEFP